jgi:carbohydrate-selective porin OprB
MAAVSYTFSFEKEKRKVDVTRLQEHTAWTDAVKKRHGTHGRWMAKQRKQKRKKGNVSFSSLCIENRKETENEWVGRGKRAERARRTRL